MQKQLISFLGIARKAGAISLGNDAVVKSIKDRKAKLVLLSSDISEKTAEKIKRYSEEYRVKLLHLNTDKEEIYTVLKKSCVVLSVDDTNFAIKIRDLILKEDM